MFNSKAKREKTGLEKAIDSVLAKMEDVEPTDPEYVKMVEQLAKLHKLKEDEKPSSVSPDTIVVAGANILGVLIIVGHERAHVLTSRAKDFMLKLR